jgi:4-diphosphocytidyl-2-C-methyl-D-erythritol kinase
MASQVPVSPQKSLNFCVDKSLTLRSPAKLNLYLNILGKYPNGYHKLESIVERISLFDTIRIKIVSGKDIIVSCSQKSLSGQANICYKAARLIQKKYHLDRGFNIHINKRIPVGAGLGGGSSNAAFTLIGINKLLGLKLSQKKLYVLGSQLGSDVNFFIAQTQFALMSGRGEAIKPFKAKPLSHLVIWPGVLLSTKEVYSNLNAKLTNFLDNAKIMQYALSTGDQILVKNSVYNGLEKTAVELCPAIRKVKSFFDKQGIFCRVTGSGSALYTIGKTTGSQGLMRSCPGNWRIFAVKTY